MDSVALQEDPAAAAGHSAPALDEPAPDAAEAAKKAAPAPSRRQRLGKLARSHALVLLAALAVFAAADSWSAVSGLGIAGLFSIIAGAAAGVTITTLVHEWFHYLGAQQSGGRFEIPARQGLFLYHWDFRSNTLRQFLVMSVAGTIGGLFAVFVLWSSVPADTWGRAALRGGAIASVVYAAYIEWPVITRCRRGGDPLAELSKIDQRLLSRSLRVATLVGIVMTWFYAP